MGNKKYDVFISFKNSDKEGNPTQDRKLAYKLYEFLKSKNLKVFFSEATLQEIGSGAWQKDIKEALKFSKIFIALGTKEEYFKSEWVQWERTTFLTRKDDDAYRAIYSYIDSPMTIGKLPKDVEYFESFENSKPNEFERIYKFIFNHIVKYFPPLDNNPYKGLDSFTYEDRENYYGRKKDIENITQPIKNSSFFTLLGASGSGKSSFLFAGIVPLLESRNVEILSFRPLNNPFIELVSIFMPVLFADRREQMIKAKEITTDLKNNKIEIIQLIDMFQKESKCQKLYIIIDQFEELFTLTKDKKEQSLFLHQLLLIINSKLNVTLIVSMRSDFLSHFSKHISFNEAFNDKSNENYFLGLFNKKSLREVIEKPSKKLGVSFESGLIERIIDEMEKEAGQLPLLEFALHRLWKHKENRVISFKSLEEIGGISESIRSYADSVHKKHIKIENSIKRVLINLVNIGRGTEYTKKRARLDEFREEDRDTITLLANERLIVTYKDKDENKNEIEIVHEILIREWDTLKGWIKEYKDFLQWQEKLQEDRIFYEENREKKEDLLRDNKLVVAKRNLKENSEYIFLLDKNFIKKSISGNRIRKIKKWVLIIVLLIGLLVAVSLSVVGGMGLQKQLNYLNNKGEDYLNEKKYYKAIEVYSQSIELFPQNAEVYDQIGLAYGKLEEYDKAINAYQKSLEIYPSDDNIYYNIGNMYALKEDYNKSREAFSQSIHINPKNDKAYRNRGMSYFEKEDYSKAKKDLQKTMEINSTQNENFYNILGKIYHELKEYKNAINAFREAIKIDSENNEFYLSIGISYSKNEEYSHAIEAFKESVKINPKDDEAYFYMGNNYVLKEEYSHAIEAFKQVIKINPKKDVVYANLGNAYLNLKMFQEAIYANQKAIEINPKQDMAYVNLGNAYIGLGKFKKAITVSKKAIEINSKEDTAYVNLGNAYINSQRFEEAIKVSKKAIEINPKQDMAYLNLGMAYIYSKKFDKAIKSLKKAIEINPKQDKAYINLGIAYMNLQKFNKAIKGFKKAIEINPKEDMVYVNIGMIDLDLNNFKEAIDVAKKAIEINSKSYEAYYIMGTSYVNLNQFYKGISLLKKAIKINSKEDMIYVNLGFAYIQTQKYHKAIKVLKKAIEINPKQALAYVNIGNAYIGLGKFKKAIEISQKAINLDSKQEIAYINLGNSYLNLKKFNKVIEASKKAIKINPERYEPYYNIGYAYFNQKDYDNSLKVYRKALSINKTNYLIYIISFKILLIKNQPFDQNLEKEYIELFQNKKETFIHYEILKILQDIANKKKVNLEQWKEKYRDIKMRLNFDILDEWIDGFDEGEVKERLREAIGVFKGHNQETDSLEIEK